MDKDTCANLSQNKSGVAILPTGKSRCQSRDDYQVQKWTVYNTLCDPMDCSPPDSSVHGILQAIILERIAIPFSRGTSPPRDRTLDSGITDRFLTVWATGKFKVKVKVGQCPSVCNPMDYTVHGILQTRILEWVAFPFSRASSQPGIEPRSPALQADSLTTEPQGKSI